MVEDADPEASGVVDALLPASATDWKLTKLTMPRVSQFGAKRSDCSDPTRAHVSSMAGKSDTSGEMRGVVGCVGILRYGAESRGTRSAASGSFDLAQDGHRRA